jgi:hypothetical protein
MGCAGIVQEFVLDARLSGSEGGAGQAFSLRVVSQSGKCRAANPVGVLSSGGDDLHEMIVRLNKRNRC